MGDAQSSAVVALAGWLAETQRIAARDPREPARERPPPPPSGLMPQDCAAVGFEFYAKGSARYGADSPFHVNFSPDLQHQTMLFDGMKRGQGAWLWVDGQAVPVPADRYGNPATAILVRWLDGRFSQGLLADVESPARALALWAWVRETGLIAMRGEHSFTREYPVPPTGFKPAECNAVGFEFHDDRSAYDSLDAAGIGTVHVDFSPDAEHQAVLLKGSHDWWGALLCVDSEWVPVPREPDGNPMCDTTARWLDNRFVSVQVGGLWEHPLLDPRKNDSLGDIRGLLVWDAVTHARQLLLPEPTQAWTQPRLSARDDSWRIYPDKDAFEQDRPDRVLPCMPHSPT